MHDLKFLTRILTTLVVVLLLAFPRLIHSLSCYECHGEERQNSVDAGYQIVKRSKAPETENVNCSRERDRCTGTACVIYDNFNDSTTGHHFFSAFCLYDRLTPPLVATSNGGCWMNEEEKGRHCVCMEDFCNVPPRLSPGEVATPIISQQLRLLERNPLIDYDYIEDEKHLSKEETPVGGSGNLKKGGHSLAEIDLDKIQAQQMDDGRGDLTPVDFKDYQQWESEGQNESEVMTNASMPHQTTTAGVVYETSPQQGLVALNNSALPAETIDAGQVHPRGLTTASGDEGSGSGAPDQHHAGYPIQAISAFIVVSFLIHSEKITQAPLDIHLAPPPSAVIMTPTFGPSSPDLDHSLEVDLKFRNFGWALLGIWLSAIIYITRDFWFPDSFFAVGFQQQREVSAPKPAATLLPPIAMFDDCSDDVA